MLLAGIPVILHPPVIARTMTRCKPWFAVPVKILLIEDDKETSAHIVFALNGEGHDVTVCHDGQEGLEAARSGGQAALIVDRMLPGLDGLSMVKQLRAEGNHTPVLFLTTMSGLNDRVEGLKGGGD